jgi:hypothetical protein
MTIVNLKILSQQMKTCCDPSNESPEVKDKIEVNKETYMCQQLTTSDLYFVRGPLSLRSPIHACPHHGSWATFIRLSHVRAKSKFPTLQNSDWSAKGDNPDRK